MGTMMRNWWTTAVGALGAIIIWYVGVGAKWPTTQEEKVAFFTGAVSAVLGYVAKDAKTGSAPSK